MSFGRGFVGYFQTPRFLSFGSFEKNTVRITPQQRIGLQLTIFEIDWGGLMGCEWLVNNNLSVRILELFVLTGFGNRQWNYAIYYRQRVS